MRTFALLFFVIFCVCASAEWVDLREEGESTVRELLKPLLNDVEKRQEAKVTVLRIKWTKLDDGGETKTYKARLVAEVHQRAILRDYTCTAIIELTSKYQELQLMCEGLMFHTKLKESNN